MERVGRRTDLKSVTSLEPVAEKREPRSADGCAWEPAAFSHGEVQQALICPDQMINQIQVVDVNKSATNSTINVVLGEGSTNFKH